MWLCTKATLWVQSAIDQYPLANDDAIPHNTDVIRSVFQHLLLLHNVFFLHYSFIYIQGHMILFTVFSQPCIHHAISKILSFPITHWVYFSLLVFFGCWKTRNWNQGCLQWCLRRDQWPIWGIRICWLGMSTESRSSLSVTGVVLPHLPQVHFLIYIQCLQPVQFHQNTQLPISLFQIHIHQISIIILITGSTLTILLLTLLVNTLKFIMPNFCNFL